MIYLRSFDTIAESKAASLLNPAVIDVYDNGICRTIMKRTNIPEEPLCVYGDLLEDLFIDVPRYVIMKCVDDGAISMSHYGTNAGPTKPNISYLKNDGVWTVWDFSIITMEKGDTIRFRGNNHNGIGRTIADYSKFQMFGSYVCGGSIMYLIDEYGDVKDIPSEYCFANLFSNCHGLKSAPNLPATTLKNYCYLRLFLNCTGLVYGPALPATNLLPFCYYYMFLGCTNLLHAPLLPAEMLLKYCYSNMFYGCSNLASAPILNSNHLAEQCYSFMFTGCTKLITAPNLPASKMEKYCYFNMFRNCTNLVNAPQLNSLLLANHCYDSMFYNCTSLETAPNLPCAETKPYCYISMFQLCTKLVNVSDLPAEHLEEACYRNMFEGCSLLETAPELWGANLVKQCYYEMFKNCSKLCKIVCHANSGISEEEATTNWLVGAPNEQYCIFYKPTYGAWARNTSGIPNKWTVKTLQI